MLLLLVDDSVDDRFFFTRALSRVCPAIEVAEVDTATGASHFLKQEHEHTGAPRPDLIVADSVLQEETGIDLVMWVRAHPVLRHIPFFILTGDTNPPTTARAREAGANGVFHKPSDFPALLDIIRRMLGAIGTARP